MRQRLFGLWMVLLTQQATKDTKRWETNSEGSVKYCRCTFFGHATPDRAGARPYRVQGRVARCDMGLPAHTCHPIWRLSRGPLLSQSGAVTETQFLIGLRVLCGLLCSALSTLHWVPVGDGFREAKRDASRPWTSRTLRARHSSLQACQHRVLCGCGYAALCPCHSLPRSQILVSEGSSLCLRSRP
jgi:hypothetical protein